MTYFVFWTADKYEGRELSEFATEAEAIGFLNKNAGNENFQFTVISGLKLEFEPVTVATKYVRK